MLPSIEMPPNKSPQTDNAKLAANRASADKRDTEMRDGDEKGMLDIATLARLAVYAVAAGVAAAMVTAFAFPQLSDGTGAIIAVVGGLCGLIYAMLMRRKPSA
jgi:hypothetical protein